MISYFSSPRMPSYKTRSKHDQGIQVESELVAFYVVSFRQTPQHRIGIITEVSLLVFPECFCVRNCQKYTPHFYAILACAGTLHPVKKSVNSNVCICLMSIVEFAAKSFVPTPGWREQDANCVDRHGACVCLRISLALDGVTLSKKFGRKFEVRLLVVRLLPQLSPGNAIITNTPFGTRFLTRLKELFSVNKVGFFRMLIDVVLFRWVKNETLGE